MRYDCGNGAHMDCGNGAHMDCNDAAVHCAGAEDETMNNFEDLLKFIEENKPIVPAVDPDLQAQLDTIAAHMKVTVITVMSDKHGLHNIAVPTMHLADVMGEHLHAAERRARMIVQHGGVWDVADVLYVWVR